jgi:glutaminase
MKTSVTLSLLKQLVEQAAHNQEGDTANYIPELSHVDKDITAIAVAIRLCNELPYKVLLN